MLVLVGSRFCEKIVGVNFLPCVLLLALLLLQKAIQVLEKHPQIASDSIAMVGLSFGTSVAFKMAAYSEVVKVRWPGAASLWLKR